MSSYYQYSARTAQPDSSSRFDELVAAMRTEISANMQRNKNLEDQISTQVKEMQSVKEKLQAMENTHSVVKSRYEEEIHSLQRQLAEAQRGSRAGPADNQHYQKSGLDWQITFNPDIKRVLDVDSIHCFAHESVVCCVKLSNDGNYLATGSNKVAQIFDLNTGRTVCTLAHGSDNDAELYIRSLCFSPDGMYLATAAEDNVIRVWDIRSKTIYNRFVGHSHEVYSLNFAPDSRTIASASSDETVRIWDTARDMNTMILKTGAGATGVAISPDGRRVAASALDKHIYLWDLNSQTRVGDFMGPDGHTDAVYCVAFTSDGNSLISGSFDSTLKLWGANSTRPGGSTHGDCIKTFKGHQDFVLSIAITPDDHWIVSGSKDNTIQLWDRETGASQLTIQAHKNSVMSVASSARGGYFATGSGDKMARVWSYRML